MTDANGTVTAEGAPDTARRSWREAFAIYAHRRVIGMAFLGFSAGLPFLLVFSTFHFWLARAGYDPDTIATMSLIGLTYSIKFLWSPVVDRIRIPVLTQVMGRRRSWMLLAMIGIGLGLLGLSMTDPKTQLTLMVWLALLVAFSSATQDVALDAYRIEAVESFYQAAMAASYQFGYRVALFFAGAVALHLAGEFSWPFAYLCMAALTLVGIVTVLVIREPTVARDSAAHLREERVLKFLSRSREMNRHLRDIFAWFIGAVVCPFVDFVARMGWLFIAILLFVAVFRISDVMMQSMTSKVYVDLGFSEDEIAVVVKTFGLVMTLVGAFLGGVLVARHGIRGPLILAAVMIAGTNLFYAWLAIAGHSLPVLAITICADNITGGLAGTIFIAYLSGLTSSNYTATQYALFSSLMTLPGKLIGSQSGKLAYWLGLEIDSVTNATLNPEAYSNFFVFVSLAGIPSILLAVYLFWKTQRLGVTT